ncbi:hypothetical protein EDC01DRAFT_762663 [Geopyxis carbonaria]|nr:hypothetical protein EDC01DRAFT_762663 [Geopyxis carbonaria]
MDVCVCVCVCVCVAVAVAVAVSVAMVFLLLVTTPVSGHPLFAWFVQFAYPGDFTTATGAVTQPGPRSTAETASSAQTHLAGETYGHAHNMVGFVEMGLWIVILVPESLSRCGRDRSDGGVGVGCACGGGVARWVGVRRVGSSWDHSQLHHLTPHSSDHEAPMWYEDEHEYATEVDFWNLVITLNNNTIHYISTVLSYPSQKSKNT